MQRDIERRQLHNITHLENTFTHCHINPNWSEDPNWHEHVDLCTPLGCLNGTTSTYAKAMTPFGMSIEQEHPELCIQCGE